MLRRALILGGLLFGALGPALSGIAAVSKQAQGETGSVESSRSASPTRRSALADVPELDKPVTYAEEKIALSDLVRKVAADTGVTLTAHQDVADEPVAVYVKEIPARELLEQIADLWDYRWSRRSGVQASGRPDLQATNDPRPVSERLNARTPERRNAVFEIWQDLASKQREEALRQGILGDAVKRIRAELARYVEIAGLPEEQVRALVAAAEEREKARRFAPYQQGYMTKPPAESEAEAARQRDLAARRLQSPITRVLARLLGRLTPEQWNQVSSGGSLVFSSTPLFDEESLPAEMERAFRAARPTLLRPPSPDPDAPTLDPEAVELLRQQERITQERWTAATGFRVPIRLQVGSGIGGAVTLSASVLPLRSGAAGSAGMFFSNETDLTLVALPRLRWDVTADDLEKERARAESDPVLGRREVFRPEAKPRRAAYGATGTPRWRLFDLMPELARVYGVQFLADAYSANAFQLADQSFNPGSATLNAQLTRYGGGRVIDRSGTLVRLRSRTWFLDRRQESPLRLVRHWQAICRERGALPIEEYLTMAATLTETQVKALPQLLGETDLPRDLLQVPPARHVLRLLAVLTPAQQRILWQGTALPVARMTPAQSQLFLAALKQIDHDGQREISLGQWLQGSLSVSLGEPSERSLPARSAALPAGAAADAPALAAAPRGGRAGILPASTVGGVDAPILPAPAAPEPAARCSVVQVRFQLQYAPNATETVTLTVSPW
jgi:hypothetical protein